MLCACVCVCVFSVVSLSTVRIVYIVNSLDFASNCNQEFIVSRFLSFLSTWERESAVRAKQWMAARLFLLYTLPRFTSVKEVVTACVYCKITGRRYKQNFREFSGNVDNVPRNMPLILGGAQGSGGTRELRSFKDHRWWSKPGGLRCTTCVTLRYYKLRQAISSDWSRRFGCQSQCQ